jgi:hypothetical protein
MVVGEIVEVPKVGEISNSIAGVGVIVDVPRVEEISNSIAGVGEESMMGSCVPRSFIRLIDADEDDEVRNGVYATLPRSADTRNGDVGVNGSSALEDD